METVEGYKYFQVKNKSEALGSPSLAGTVWAEGLKHLCCANRSASYVCACKVTFWCACWWQGVLV